MKELLKKDETIENMKADLKKIAQANALFGFEVPQRIHFSSIPFNTDNEILTPSFKIRRYEAK